jgi:putative transposase
MMEAEYNHLNHATWECKYHVVFTPKYRKKLLFGKITVVTKYPRAQNLWRRKFRILRSTFCAIHIELFPFMYPMIWATEYLGGMPASS